MPLLSPVEAAENCVVNWHLFHRCRPCHYVNKSIKASIILHIYNILMRPRRDPLTSVELHLKNIKSRIFFNIVPNFV